DGIALYDRGMFIAWKQLLLKGIIKPSEEAANKYIQSAESGIKNAKEKLKNTINTLIIEDVALSMLTAAQAVIMDYGLLPGDPKETPEMLRKLFVSRNLLKEEVVANLEKVWKMRKDFEYGIVKEYKYEDLIDVFEIAERFINEMKNLKKIIDNEKQKKVIENYISQYEVLKEEFKSLYGEDFVEYIRKNIKEEVFGLEDLEKQINSFKSGKFDIVENEKLKERILYYLRIIRNLIENIKENLIIKYKFTIYDESGQGYDTYVTKKKIYVIKGSSIDVYDYGGNKIATINNREYINDILKELINEGVSVIDTNLMNALSKIFKSYTISK
ncbi:MAG: hypothetical protein ACPLX8_02425, partial [Nanopusillaceae archaeon]